MGAGAGGAGSSFVVLHAESASTIAIAKSARIDLLVLLIERIPCAGQNESRVEVPTSEARIIRPEFSGQRLVNIQSYHRTVKTKVDEAFLAQDADICNNPGRTQHLGVIETEDRFLAGGHYASGSRPAPNLALWSPQCTPC